MHWVVFNSSNHLWRKQIYQLKKNYDLKTRTLSKNTRIFHKKKSKSTPKSKSGATGSTMFLNGVKITTFFKHGLQNLDSSLEKP